MASTSEIRNRTCFVTLTGEFDRANVDQLVVEIKDCLNEAPSVLFDFAAVTYVNGAVVSLLLDILDTAREGFTAEETQAGVDFIGRTAPGRYATADTVAEEAAGLALEGLTTEFTTENLRALLQVDAARLDAAYRRYVAGQWTVVIVGDASLYAEGVRGLGRGEVTVLPA